MSGQRRHLSKTHIFVLLMVFAATVSLLPSPWTRWARGFVQPLAPVEWTALMTTQSARDAVRNVAEGGLTNEQARLLRQNNDELTRLALHQQERMADLEAQIAELTGLRGQITDASAGLIVASVISFDASAQRDTILIGRGSVDGVHTGMWVAAGVPADEQAPGAGGGELLMRQWLLGRVSEVSTYTSRVMLASDPKFGAPQSGVTVSLARNVADGRWEPTQALYVLTGSGNGQMRVERADADYAALGYEAVLVPASAELPATLSIGKIVSSARLEASPLHYDLRVEPWGDVTRLRRVYLIVPG